MSVTVPIFQCSDTKNPQVQDPPKYLNMKCNVSSKGCTPETADSEVFLDCDKDNNTCGGVSIPADYKSWGDIKVDPYTFKVEISLSTLNVLAAYAEKDNTDLVCIHTVWDKIIDGCAGCGSVCPYCDGGDDIDYEKTAPYNYLSDVWNFNGKYNRNVYRSSCPFPGQGTYKVISPWAGSPDKNAKLMKDEDGTEHHVEASQEESTASGVTCNTNVPHTRSWYSTYKSTWPATISCPPDFVKNNCHGTVARGFYANDASKVCKIIQDENLHDGKQQASDFRYQWQKSTKTCNCTKASPSSWKCPNDADTDAENMLTWGLSGTQTCTYSYSFENYGPSCDNPNSQGYLPDFITDLVKNCNGSTAAPTGPGALPDTGDNKSNTQVRDAAVVCAFAKVCSFEMYDPTTRNNIMNIYIKSSSVDIYNPNTTNFNKYKSDIFDWVTGPDKDFAKLYSGQDDSSLVKIKTACTTYFAPPALFVDINPSSQSGEDFYVILVISPITYNDLKLGDPETAADDVVSNLAAILLGDPIQISVAGSQKITDPAYYTLAGTNVTAIALDNKNTYDTICVSKSDFDEEYEDKYRTNGYYVMNIQLICRVEEWSPALMSYFAARQTSGSKTFTDLSLAPSPGSSVCGDLPSSATAFTKFDEKSCNTFKNLKYSLPESCMQYYCVDHISVADCSEVLAKYCPVQFCGGTNCFLKDAMLQSAENTCTCQNSTLGQVVSPHDDYIPGMCFDTSCEGDVNKTVYNLTDDNCKQYCSTAWNWANSSSPILRIYPDGYPDNFNQERYNDLCGSSYKPPMNTKI